eukprot:gene1182-32520_t
MYGVIIGAEEGLTSYLVRCQELYSQIPTTAGGVSTLSKDTFHTILIKGLNPRPEFAGFVQSYHTLHITDFLGLSSALMQYAQDVSVLASIQRQLAELTASVSRFSNNFNTQVCMLKAEVVATKEEIALWKAEVVSNETEIALLEAEDVSNETEIALCEAKAAITKEENDMSTGRGVSQAKPS